MGDAKFFSSENVDQVKNVFNLYFKQTLVL